MAKPPPPDLVPHPDLVPAPKLALASNRVPAPNRVPASGTKLPQPPAPGTTLAVRVTPKAARERIGEVRALPDGTPELCVYVTVAPEDGKANAAVLRLLAKHFGVAPSSLRVMRGAQGRNKLVGFS